LKGIRWALLAGGAMAVSFALSFVHPSGNPRKIAVPTGSFFPGAQIPPRVRNVIANKCIDCHSEQTQWPVYSRLAPASWLLEYDITKARSRWNLSRWNLYGPDEQMELLAQLGLRAKTASMPPARYTLLHPASKLTNEERTSLYEWARTERRRLRSMASPTDDHENKK
jgi:hypothetical protein